jgi:cobalt-zinc-cadmium efflux system outer membrane protein
LVLPKHSIAVEMVMNIPSRPRQGKLAAVLALALSVSLSACVSIPEDRGIDEVNALLAERHPGFREQGWQDINSLPNAAQQVTQLLAQPLTPERALQVALLRNPQVRVTYAQLGISQAEWQAASSLSNPELEFSVLDTGAAGEMLRLGYGLVQNFTDILFLPARRRAADAQLTQQKAEIAAHLQMLAANVAEAYFDAVSSEQIYRMHQVIAQAAENSAQLAQRFHSAGNLTALELARIQAGAEQALLEVDSAQAEAADSKARLNAQMGLPPFTQWRTEEQLPLPIRDESKVKELVQLSLKQRLDLHAKQLEIEALAEQLDIAKDQRWFPHFNLGIEGERESDGVNFIGPTVGIELPLFGSNRARVNAQWARYEQAQAEGDLLVGQVANGVTAAYARMLAARNRAERHRTGLIPQREAIVARSQEMQNFMLIGQFELLEAKQEEYEAYGGYLEALKDYWLARVDLTRAVGAVLPSEQIRPAATEAAIELPKEAPASGHHGHHMNHGAPSNNQADQSQPSHNQHQHNEGAPQ